MSAAVAETDTPNAGRASGSSFYAAMRILPKPQREAMFAIYGFCRQVDDIANSPGPRDERRAALAAWRSGIDALYRGHPTRPDRRSRPARAGLRTRKRRFSRPSSTAWKWMCSPTFAPRPGRSSIFIATGSRARWGGCRSASSASTSSRAAISLIISAVPCSSPTSCAISTKTPRVGRLYLPREALLAGRNRNHRAGRGSGQSGTGPRLRSPSSPWPASISIALTPSWRHRSRRAVRAPRIMGEVYRLILEGMAERGFAPPRPPVRLGRARLAFILMRYAFI